MSEDGYPPTKDDFASKPWEGVIEALSEKTCFSYCSRFCGLAAGEEDAAKKSVWRFLARLTSFTFNLESNDDPSSGVVDALSVEEIELTKSLVPEVADPELKARMADIIWTRQRKGNFPFVKIAFEAYLESARRLEDPDNWVYGADRTERAFQLALTVNNTDFRNSIVDYIDEMITRCNGEDPYYLSAKMMNLLLDQGAGEPVKYAPLAEKLATRAEQAKDFHKAKDYWDIHARWHRLGGDEENARLSSIRAAETHVLIAQARLEQGAAPFLHAAGHIQHAIEAYRRISGTQECERRRESAARGG